LKTRAPIIAGVDLAATPLNPTGWGTLKGRVISACHLFNDKEIVSKILECKPKLIAVDAPLNLPKNKKITRKADREMQKRGYTVFQNYGKTHCARNKTHTESNSRGIRRH